ncbi:hypothetical protein CDAR_315221 [Caerostris darwini]|uniref:Uncharacterized protein n=1 Tax=Caerostris darwini TaxID=1538125 RepID=A0AAV4TA82_9ARAC|nr:hypothetical protein CDAR_315221 [Caerostris darwini]
MTSRGDLSFHTTSLSSVDGIFEEKKRNLENILDVLVLDTKSFVSSLLVGFKIYLFLFRNQHSIRYHTYTITHHDPECEVMCEVIWENNSTTYLWMRGELQS